MSLPGISKLKLPSLSFRLVFAGCLVLLLVITYTKWLSNFPIYQWAITPRTTVSLPLPDFRLRLIKTTFASAGDTSATLSFLTKPSLDIYQKNVRDKVRQQEIDRVEAFFTRYGSNLVGYGHIFVDQANACGGDYKVLVGIAGSESGLGRSNYLRFNPFGYLNGVQYDSYDEALPILTCLISQQHIVPCGEDVECLANRYAGPDDDHAYFSSKVLWFMNQV